MRAEKDIDELLKAGVISSDVAERIRNYYAGQSEDSAKRLYAIFGILGATLVGLGIILVLAHNWDELSRSTKTLLAFAPLLTGQAMCGYVLIRNFDNTAWREASASFLFLSVGACIALVSQVYNILGNLNDFLFTWMLLCLPLIYLLRSSVSFLFYIAGVTVYAISTGYGSSFSSQHLLHWLMLLAALPHYYISYKRSRNSNFFAFQSWFIALSLVISLGTLADEFSYFMFMAYSSLFGLFYLIGNTQFFKNQALRNNSFLIVGSLGTIYILLHLSFVDLWNRMINDSISLDRLLVSPEFLTAMLLSLLSGGLYAKLWKAKSIRAGRPLGLVFLVFMPTFMLGIWLPFSVILINMLTLALGIRIIQLGIKSDNLGQMNLGLLLITLLVACRFFDTDWSFVIRGVLFVLLGGGFFVANHWILKKRKTNEK